MKYLSKHSLFFLFICVFLLDVGCESNSIDDEFLYMPPELSEFERFPGGETTETLPFFTEGTLAFGAHLKNITVEHEQRFHAGRSFFRDNWVAAPASTEGRDGLGPLFNARSCAACHTNDGRGRPSLGEGSAHKGLLLRLGISQLDLDLNTTPDPTYGDQLQDFSQNIEIPIEGTIHLENEVIEGNFDDGEHYTLLSPSYKITSPGYGDLPEGLRISPRVAPAMIGLGLLEAIPESRILSFADPSDENGDGISGKPHFVFDVETQQMRLGRFGWKAEQPTVKQQVAGAFVGDMGLTSRLFPNENCTEAQNACFEYPNGGEPEVEDAVLENVTLYSKALAPPVRPDWNMEQVLRGRELFYTVGCQNCHTPSHVTGQDSLLEELSHQKIWPYTDLLLHDMGEGLADHKPVGEANGREWKTPPLWGIGHIPDVNRHNRLLHDGRARGIAEAILWHGGEAATSQEAFKNLRSEERAALVRFVESL